MMKKRSGRPLPGATGRCTRGRSAHPLAGQLRRDLDAIDARKHAIGQRCRVVIDQPDVLPKSRARRRGPAAINRIAVGAGVRREHEQRRAGYQRSRSLIRSSRVLGIRRRGGRGRVGRGRSVGLDDDAAFFRSASGRAGSVRSGPAARRSRRTGRTAQAPPRRTRAAICRRRIQFDSRAFFVSALAFASPRSV